MYCGANQAFLSSSQGMGIINPSTQKNSHKVMHFCFHSISFAIGVTLYNAHIEHILLCESYANGL